MRLLSTTVPQKRLIPYQGLLFLSFCFPPTAAPARASAITATVDIAKMGAPISKRWWAPVGGESVVTTDSSSPYIGEQSPAVHLSRTEPHGVRQPGLVVRVEKSYTRPITLAGTLEFGRHPPQLADATIKAVSPAEVQVEEQSLDALPATLTLRPYSVNIYSYPVH